MISCNPNVIADYLFSILNWIIMENQTGLQVNKIFLTQQWTIENFGSLFSTEETFSIDGPVIRVADDCQLQIKLHKKESRNFEFSFYLENIEKTDVSVVFNSITLLDYDDCGTYSGMKTRINSGEKSLIADSFYKRDFTEFDVSKVDGNLTVCFDLNIKPESPVTIAPPDSLSGDLAKSLNEGLKSSFFPDWRLLCEGKQIVCHRFILSSRSKAFKKIFQSPDPKEHDDTTVINNVDLETLQDLIKYIYTDVIDDANMNNSDLAKLFSAADEFGIPGKTQHSNV